MRLNHSAVDRQETVTLFRERLADVIQRSGLTQSSFAEKVGMDRSTLSQLLSPKNDRLPRADSIVAIARTQHVSIDWLLGVTQQGSLGADILRQSLEIERDARSPADVRLGRWHDEAMGYKIRYVPTTLPDMLKTERIIEYEYRESAAFTPEQSLDIAQSKLAYLRRPETDMDVCNSRQAIEAFARGEGLWHALDASARRAQLERMIELTQELYPAFRWFLYDSRQRFSSPITIFGPKRAVIYVGQMYLVFNTLEHIRVLTKHFDDLIRNAVVQPTQIVDFIRALLTKI
jgi:transcriptional regulator with XRE-family HTH domain